MKPGGTILDKNLKKTRPVFHKRAEKAVFPCHWVSLTDLEPLISYSLYQLLSSHKHHKTPKRMGKEGKKALAASSGGYGQLFFSEDRKASKSEHSSHINTPKTLDSCSKRDWHNFNQNCWLQGSPRAQCLQLQKEVCHKYEMTLFQDLLWSLHGGTPGTMSSYKLVWTSDLTLMPKHSHDEMSNKPGQSMLSIQAVQQLHEEFMEAAVVEKP